MSSGRRKNPMKTSTIIKIVVGLAILAAVIFFGMRYLRSKVDEKFASTDESSVESAQVTTGSISTTVAGSGTLAYEDSEDTTLPAEVEVKKYYVSAGDTIAEGDLMASVNMTTVITAMSDIQSEIDDLDEELEDAADETIDDTIEATVSGRVKAIFAEKGDDVASIMYDKNALMLISLDGLMAVDVTTDELAVDDSVKVTTGGTTYTGTVEKVLAGVATITLTDKGPEYDADAEVLKDGNSVGSGKLYIHRSISVTGYAGTVSKVKVDLDDEVDEGDDLFTLSDTSYTANYDSLLSQREDLEDQLSELLAIYKEGAVYAKEDGVIVSLTKGVTPSDSDSSSSSSSSSSNSSGSTSSGMSAMMSAYGMSSASASTGTSSSTDGTDTVFSISPKDHMNLTVSVDESDILSLSEGQEAAVTVDSLDDQTFTGTVTEISTEGTSSNGVTTYSAVIQIEKTDEMLSGMSADATITIEGKDNALLIPVDALNKTSSTAYVYTTYDEETDTLGGMTEVTIGISNSSYVEITDGLSEGDTVYYEPSADSSEFDFSDFSGMGGGQSMPSDMGGGNWSGDSNSHGNKGMNGGMPGGQ